MWRATQREKNVNKLEQTRGADALLRDLVCIKFERMDLLL